VAEECFDILLRLLHPIIPFVTEELWEKLPERKNPLIISPFPEKNPNRIFPEAENEMGLLMDLVRKVRNVRGEMRIDPGIKIKLLCRTESVAEQEIIVSHIDQVKALIRAEHIVFDDKLPGKEIGARGRAEGIEFFIPLAGVMDVEKEKERNLKALQIHEKENERIDRKLGNEQFLKKAPPEVVDKNKAMQRDIKEKIEGIRKILSILEHE